ncbi:MAG: hypothetical protein NC411_09370 [Bacteroides sp.]|nr:hypothetical protein [Bacteroides sp.]
MTPAPLEFIRHPESAAGDPTTPHPAAPNSTAPAAPVPNSPTSAPDTPTSAPDTDDPTSQILSTPRPSAWPTPNP